MTKLHDQGHLWKEVFNWIYSFRGFKSMMLDYYFRAGTPTPPPTELALLCCPGYVQGVLSREMRLMRGRVRHWGLWGGHLSPTHAIIRQMRNGDSSLMLTTLGLAHPYLCQQGWFCCAFQARWRACYSDLMTSGLALLHSSVFDS